jgi:hypothetical protein
MVLPYAYLHLCCFFSETAGDSDTRQTTVLPLATLVDATQVGLFLFHVASTKVAKGRTVVCVVSLLPAVSLKKQHKCK